MKIEINKARCTGHGRCYDVAPGVYDADEDGFGVVRDGPLEGYEADARLGEKSCPEAAITVTD